MRLALLPVLAALAAAGSTAAAEAQAWRRAFDGSEGLSPGQALVVSATVRGRVAQLRFVATARPRLPIALGVVVTCSSGLPSDEDYRERSLPFQARSRAGAIERVVAVTVPPGRRPRCHVAGAVANAGRRAALVRLSVDAR